FPYTTLFRSVVLAVLREAGVTPELANVKIIGPLRRNIGLVNVRPTPDGNVRERLRSALQAIKELDEVHVADGPLTLVAKASPAIPNDPHARHWIQHGPLAPDFAAPIAVDSHPPPHTPVGPCHTLAFAPAYPAAPA